MEKEPKAKEAEDTVTIPKSQLDLLTAQLETLALQMALNSRKYEKDQEESDSAKPYRSLKETPLSRTSQEHPANIVKLLDSVAKYSGKRDQSYPLWKEKVQGFLTTFNLAPSAIEPHFHKLLSGNALYSYRVLQSDLKSTKNVKYPSWDEIHACLSQLDDPVKRSIHIHKQIERLMPHRRPKEMAVAEVVDRFRELEYELDPAPLGDRIYLFFKVLPAAEYIVMSEPHKSFESMDDVYNLVKEKHNSVQVCNHCFKAGHRTAQCFQKRKMKKHSPQPQNPQTNRPVHSPQPVQNSKTDHPPQSNRSTHSPQPNRSQSSAESTKSVESSPNQPNQQTNVNTDDVNR
ncbi:hypothetical protein TRVA0_001S04522 [Trichomonascus vanleenenianus]|uniref:uncharacterized protein n=1 Tax=Trichomonascus vanleenenianus TaxID=2268995 RepID=UPI003ECA790D